MSCSVWKGEPELATGVLSNQGKTVPKANGFWRAVIWAIFFLSCQADSSAIDRLALMLAVVSDITSVGVFLRTVEGCGFMVPTCLLRFQVRTDKMVKTSSIRLHNVSLLWRLFSSSESVLLWSTLKILVGFFWGGGEGWKLKWRRVRVWFKRKKSDIGFFVYFCFEK